MEPRTDETPGEIWAQALALLQRQLDPATFAALLSGSWLERTGKEDWTIGVRHAFAPERLAGQLDGVVRRTVALLAGREIGLNYECAPPRVPVEVPEAAPPAVLPEWLDFDPNSAAGGGYWQMGHYANWFWASLLGAVAWRVYELLVAGDKRRNKTLWTPPRRYSISELARSVASGRDGRPNRDQIRGRYRRVNGERCWRPGAFDHLVRHGVAAIEWHSGDRMWHVWQPGGAQGQVGRGQRRFYRFRVVTRLPLLTPAQVARLSDELQVRHERYLVRYGLDLDRWEQIRQPTLAGVNTGSVAAS